jgi:hypothetical protein
MELLAALMLCGGILLFLWALTGATLYPIHAEGMLLLWRVGGDVTELEKTVRGLLRLQKAGFFSATVVLVDCGLTADSRKRAELLTREERWMHLIAEKDLCTYFDFARTDHGTGI